MEHPFIAITPRFTLTRSDSAYCGLTQSAGAAEYTDCFSAEEYDSSNKCPG